MRKNTESREQRDWTKLLVEAVNDPGILSSAYRQFWNYSVGNQLLAVFECLHRGIELGPLSTFKGWLAVGRHVKRGEKAITLCMPVTVPAKSRPEKRRSNAHRRKARSAARAKPLEPTEHQPAARKTVFLYRARWFVLSQTEGTDYVPTELPLWSEVNALQGLRIERVTFDHPNGNCQGFARARQVAVSPVAEHPHATLFHEMAHVVLEHTLEGALDDHDRTPRSLREVEAECVALICCASLKLPGIPECRGYIQHWLRGQPIPDGSVQKIFRAADSILKGGVPVAARKIAEGPQQKMPFA